MKKYAKRQSQDQKKVSRPIDSGMANQLSLEEGSRIGRPEGRSSSTLSPALVSVAAIWRESEVRDFSAATLVRDSSRLNRQHRGRRKSLCKYYAVRY